MYVRQLSLTNFRCYRQLELALPDGVVVVSGGNAQGKTSLLEALYVLATTRSLHASTDRDVVNWDSLEDPAPHARLRADVVRAADNDTVEIVYAGEAGADGEVRFSKKPRINGVPRRAFEVLGQLAVVLFTPRDIQIVDGSPAERRRYLDILLCQADRDYCRALSRYNRLIGRRNHLLRRLRDKGGDRSELDYWDGLLAREGGVVVSRRGAASLALNDRAGSIHSQLVDGGSRLRVEYLSAGSAGSAGSTGREPGATTVLNDGEAAQNLASLLAQRRDAEIARGSSLVGPQRDDLRFTVDGVDMRYFGSRGQQRTVTLALKLAEAQYMRTYTGERPVLLLDDVMSELDSKRRLHLLDALDDRHQTLLTTTDTASLPPTYLQNALVLEITGGTASQIGSAPAERDRTYRDSSTNDANEPAPSPPDVADVD